MEEAQEILLNSLENSGVPIPPGVSSIQDLTPTSLVSICSQSLRIIDDTSSFPTSLPDSMADRFRICTELAEAIKNLGYIGDMSFHKFLYPSEEDLYKLVRFLVERLSESSEGEKIAAKKNINARAKLKENNLSHTSKDWTEKVDAQGADLNYQKVGDKLKDLKLETEVSESSNTKDENVFVSNSHEDHIVPQKTEVVAVDEVSTSGMQDFCKEELSSVKGHKESLEESGASTIDASGNEEKVTELEQKLTSLKEKSSKMFNPLQVRQELENLRSQEKVLKEEVTVNSSELQHLEEEHELLKAAVDMAFDDQHPVDFYIEQLNARVDEKKRNLVELESQWEAFRKPLEEKKRSLEESLLASKPEVREKYQKLKEVDLETQSVLSEITKRKEVHSKLSADLEKQPKVASRRSYIQRITEITKNSRKQDADIERILKETRELQLESNSIQERLHRTYAVVDETVFREAKKDPVGRQAYKLLTGIHESFGQISEKILAMDRTRRDIAEHETKLAAMASRSLNVDKLQADLDAIRKENEYLEQRHRDNTNY